MRVARKCLLSGACLLSTLLALPAVLLSVAGVVERAWYFPGDPPYFELALAPAVLGLTIAGGSLWAQHVGVPRELRSKSLLVGAAVASFLCTASLLVAIGGIAFRQGPAWREVRRGIQTYGAAIGADVGDRGRVITPVEGILLRDRHMPRPVAVALPGFGTVHLRLAHGVYPYVGVDFGNGHHALFEPTLMLCTYSD
jgi:hypothetical protein